MRIYEICFSPTGGTQKAANVLAHAIADEISEIDLTNSRFNFQGITLSQDDISIIAVPSYGGRVPEPAVSRIMKVHGNGAKAVIVCVYGNRAYEDTLVELLDAAKQAGFHVVAAVAAIAEHSIARQYAAGRPDARDDKLLCEFGDKIKLRIISGKASEPQVPGTRPYKKRGGGGLIPRASKNCTQCGLCAQKCPVQAISKSDAKIVDAAKCISCMRCVAICPQSARKVNPVMLSAVSAVLKKVCSVRRECELYL